MKSPVQGAEAEKAYSAFLTFKDGVKKNQVSSAGPAAPVPSVDRIGEAAKKLSDAPYPLLEDIDWLSDLYTSCKVPMVLALDCGSPEKTPGNMGPKKCSEAATPGTAGCLGEAAAEGGSAGASPRSP